MVREKQRPINNARPNNPFVFRDPLLGLDTIFSQPRRMKKVSVRFNGCMEYLEYTSIERRFRPQKLPLLFQRIRDCPRPAMNSDENFAETLGTFRFLQEHFIGAIPYRVLVRGLIFVDRLAQKTKPSVRFTVNPHTNWLEFEGEGFTEWGANSAKILGLVEQRNGAMYLLGHSSEAFANIKRRKTPEGFADQVGRKAVKFGR